MKKIILILMMLVMASIVHSLPEPSSYYNFQGNAEDIIGSYNGVVSGATYNSTGGRVGGAYRHDGTNDLINTTNTAEYRSINFWMKGGTNGLNSLAVIGTVRSATEVAGDWHWLVGCADNHNRFYLYEGNGDECNINYAVDICPSSYRMYTLVKNDTHMVLYVNATRYGSVACTTTKGFDGATALLIGQGYESGGLKDAPADTYFDEVALYSSNQLTQSEITELYNNPGIHPSIYSNLTVPNPPLANSSFIFQVNTTDVIGISRVNITFFYNGLSMQNTPNATYSGDDLWNATYTPRITGAYNIYTEVTNTEGSISTANHSISLTSNMSSLVLNIYRENNGTLIQQEVTVEFSSNITSWENTTSTGSLTLLNLTSDVYRVLFSSTGYTTKSYIITTGTAQNLNVYLPLNNTETTIFTVIDKDTEELLSNALISMYRFINGDWQVVESKYTDITGKAQFTYVSDIKYQFFISKQNYNDYIFFLDPVLFDEYSVEMQKSILINYSQDYDNLAIIYSPTSFNNGIPTKFDFYINSPTGLLSDYGYTLRYPGGADTQTGTNAIGEILTSTITTSATTIDETVNLTYYYVTSLSQRRNFTIYLPININTTGNNMTWMSNKDKTFGLGLFERLLISTLIIIFVVGIATMVGQPLPGLAMGLMVFGFMTYIGFISLWAVIPSFVMGVFILMWKSGG